MFGWFDKKHLGWLSRFMEKTMVFPIPGDGKFMRQPLFVNDICKVVHACLKQKPRNKTFNIIGKEKISYIDLMKKIRDVKKLSVIILPIPIPLFEKALQFYGFFSNQPPFTPDQLKALTAGDEFPIFAWWKKFHVTPTPLNEALQITFAGKYSKIICQP